MADSKKKTHISVAKATQEIADKGKIFYLYVYPDDPKLFKF